MYNMYILYIEYINIYLKRKRNIYISSHLPLSQVFQQLLQLCSMPLILIVPN